MDSRQVIRALEAEGWTRKSQSGSHLHLEHAERPGKVTVPHPRKDLPIKTLRSIERQAGVSLRRK